ncbi:hypothetical protein FGA82_20060 [Pseudomonas fluorescens]|nr:hypothetical protein FGA82_20060 [Pseudomonas fluorescens]
MRRISSASSKPYKPTTHHGQETSLTKSIFRAELITHLAGENRAGKFARYTGAGFCSDCNAPFASKLAPTGVRIPNVGASLLAKGP